MFSPFLFICITVIDCFFEIHLYYLGTRPDQVKDVHEVIDDAILHQPRNSWSSAPVTLIIKACDPRVPLTSRTLVTDLQVVTLEDVGLPAPTPDLGQAGRRGEAVTEAVEAVAPRVSHHPAHPPGLHISPAPGTHGASVNENSTLVIIAKKN